MDTVNLLSKELAPDNSYLKVSKGLKTVAIGGLVLFIAAALIITAIFIANRIELSRVRSSQNSLKQSIQSMQATEQQYVLVKDRASKGVQALNSQNSEKDFDFYRNFYDQVIQDANIVRAEINQESIEMQLNATSIDSLGRVLERLRTNTEYPNVKVNSFSFRSGSGYDMDIEVLK